MAAAATGTLDLVQDYITDARTLLLDTVQAYRYSDAELVIALNVTIADARRLRADLFLGDGTNTNMTPLPYFSISEMLEEVPIEPQFRLAILYGLVAHALTRDQEDVQDARAKVFRDTFRMMLVSTEA